MTYNLDSKKVELYFNEIKTGFRVLQVKDGKQVLYLKYPDSFLMSEISIYENELRHRYKGKILTKDEILLKFKKNLVKKENIEDIDSLIKSSKKISVVIEHYINAPVRNEDTIALYKKKKEDIDRRIEKSRNLLGKKNIELSSVKERLLINCLENKINQACVFKYLENVIYYRNNNGKMIPYFSVKNFKTTNERIMFVNSVVEEFMQFMSGYEESEIRALARSGFVMNIYKISHKTNTPIFPGSATEYSNIQLSLLVWCDYYHSIATNFGLPESDILNNDKLFDKWIEKKMNDISGSDKSRKNNSNTQESERKDVFLFSEPKRAIDNVAVR